MTSRKKKHDGTKGAGYLPFLKGPPIRSEGDIGPEAYAMMSRGLQALYAEREAAKQQMVEMLLAPRLPSPTAASSQEMH
jgi:hypothetical protein